MPVPARKKSNASGRRRRSHDALSLAASSVCSQCASALQPHHACSTCGFYKGRSVINKEKSAKRLVKKSKKS